MKSSKYYAQNEYLQSVMNRLPQNRPILKEENETPFYFQKKTMNEFGLNQIIQQKILENPDKYADTHVNLQNNVGQMQHLQ
jgi:hypothetical protein